MATHQFTTSKKSKNHSVSWENYGDILWDAKGVKRVDYLLDQKTMNSQYYSQLLKDKVKPAFRHKWRKAQKSICFLQDNACPHTAALTMGDCAQTLLGFVGSSPV